MKVVKHLKLWVTRFLLFAAVCWCGLRIYARIKPDETHKLVHQRSESTISLLKQTIPGKPVTDISMPIGYFGDSVKPYFKFSLEPGTNKRRLPERFRMNSPQIKGSEYDFLKLPLKPNCRRGIELIILVKSAVRNFEQRIAIRETWGSITEDANQVLILFLLGLPNKASSKEMARFKNELNDHDDIIVGNFIDAYTNVTIKSLTGLRFVSEYCSEVEFMLSVDDDVFVILKEMIFEHFLFIARPARRVLQCGLQTVKSAKVTRRGKWAVEVSKYDRLYYPPYCNGPCFLMSVDVALALYNASNITPCDIPIDDAVITGILREKVGIELSAMRRGLCSHLVNPFNVPEKMYRLWNETRLLEQKAVT